LCKAGRFGSGSYIKIQETRKDRLWEVVSEVDTLPERLLTVVVGILVVELPRRMAQDTLLDPPLQGSRALRGALLLSQVAAS
ncbi:MAG: hypothetical protein M3220_21760, partial [Chloroflexota bacterium]|nr:hypothetical protein [Chloroflexota bacterium]